MVIMSLNMFSFSKDHENGECFALLIFLFVSGGVAFANGTTLYQLVHN